jgi:hypothetical protein
MVRHTGGGFIDVEGVTIATISPLQPSSENSYDATYCNTLAKKLTGKNLNERR